MKNKNKKQKYSSLEKKAYYTGMGVGLSGDGPSNGRLTSRMKQMMTEKEFESYINGYERGLDNVTILAGIRNPKKWF